MENEVKYEIWGFKWINSFFTTSIPEKLVIAALDTENNNLVTAEYSKEEVKMFLLAEYPDVELNVKDVNVEIIKKMLNYYILNW